MIARLLGIFGMLTVISACSPRDDSTLHAQIVESIGSQPPYSAVGVIRCSGNENEAQCMECTLTAYEPGVLDNRVFAELQEYNFVPRAKRVSTSFRPAVHTELSEFNMTVRPWVLPQPCMRAVSGATGRVLVSGMSRMTPSPRRMKEARDERSQDRPGTA